MTRTYRLTQSCLKRHMQSMHDEAYQAVKCTMCDKLVKNKFALPKHIRTVHSGRRHQCVQCDKAFKNATQLKVRNCWGNIFDHLNDPSFVYRNMWHVIPEKVCTIVRIVIRNSKRMQTFLHIEEGNISLSTCEIETQGLNGISMRLHRTVTMIKLKIFQRNCTKR